MHTPTLYIIAGCNGAGKTTASMSVLPEVLDCREFVNADEIAKGLSPFRPEEVAIEDTGRARVLELLVPRRVQERRNVPVERGATSRRADAAVRRPRGQELALRRGRAGRFPRLAAKPGDRVRGNAVAAAEARQFTVPARRQGMAQHVSVSVSISRALGGIGKSATNTTRYPYHKGISLKRKSLVHSLYSTQKHFAFALMSPNRCMQMQTAPCPSLPEGVRTGCAEGSSDI